MEESPLSPALLRGLADRSYDKRKAAAAEVATLVKYLVDNSEDEKITRVISLLSNDFIKSRNANHRKGGLIGLASAAIGLFPLDQPHLSTILLPIVSCFDDQEPRVCYYSCESCYNVVKVARSAVLPYLNDLVDGLIKLFAQNDVDIKNGASMLDRLVKDVVIETPTSINTRSFILLIQRNLSRRKPYIRQLMMSWIDVLNGVADVHMPDYLPELLLGLFTILSDPNKEIRQTAENLLSDFLAEVRTSDVVDLLPLVNIVVSLGQSKENLIRLTSIIWLSSFIAIGTPQLIPLYPIIFDATMKGISDTEADISDSALTANSELKALVATTFVELDYKPFIITISNELESSNIVSKAPCLHWLLMLHNKNAVETNKHLPVLLPILLKTLSDADSDVVTLNLRVIAQVSEDSHVFQDIVQSLTAVLASDRELLETRGALIIRKLCALLDAHAVFTSLADTLLRVTVDDKALRSYEFISVYSHALNIILLTAPETLSLRSALKSALDSGSQYRSVFISLYKSWCPNPAAVLSLCLVSEAYHLSANIVRTLTEYNIGVGLLMQLDKLVQLIDSPVFIQLRMQLLDANSRHHADLLKTLYGILMILPQSEAFRMLSTRLQACSALQSHLSSIVSNIPLIIPSENRSASSTLDMLIDSGRKMHLGVSDRNNKNSSSIQASSSVDDVADLSSYFITIHSAYTECRSKYAKNSTHLNIEM